LFFELLNEVHGEISIGGAPSQLGGSPSDPATCGIGRSYKAKGRACHPSVVFFVRLAARSLPFSGLLAHKSGLLALVSASASAFRQAATLAWSPESRISGIGAPSKICGLVYCEYSNRPWEKLSSAPYSAFPITPGKSRTQASISAMAAISPPDST